MSNSVIITIAIVIFLVMLLTGHYISSAMMFAGMVGIILIDGGRINLVGSLLMSEPWVKVANYSMTTVPLYLFMAQFIMRADIVKDFYSLVFKVSKGKRGLLGILTVALGGFLGAVSGVATASSASIAQIATPELRKKGYSDSLCGSIAAASGSLAAVIPPSVTLIIYATITQAPVGQLFMATLIPGLLTMAVFMVVTLILLRSSVKEKAEGSADEAEGQEEQTPVSRYIFVCVSGLLMMGSIFIGIYTGLFTPTEAGAVGAFIAFVVACIAGKVNRTFLRECMENVLKTTCFSLFIVVCAAVFGKFVSLSLIPRMLMTYLAPLIERPHLLLLLLLVIYFFLFMFVEAIAVFMMTIPILLPLVQAAGIDVVWFGIFLCLLSTLGLLTPPVGMCVYTASAASGIPIGPIFKKGIIYAIVAAVIVGGGLVLFPDMALWLPAHMH